MLPAAAAGLRACACCMQVLSMSLGGGGDGARGSCGSSGNPLREAVCAATAAGVTVVVAAGNEDSNLALSDPASFPEALTVTAMGDSDGRPGEAHRRSWCWRWCWHVLMAAVCLLYPVRCADAVGTGAGADGGAGAGAAHTVGV